MLLDYHRLGFLRWVLATLGVLVCLYLLTPIVFIFLLSLGSSRWLAFPPPEWTTRWYVEFFSNPQWVASILTSAQVAAIVMVLSVFFGLLASLAIIRGRFPGRTAIRAFLLTPMVLPVIVLAVGLYALFLRTGLHGTILALVCAHLVIALPFSVIVISNSLVSFDRAIEDAAIICGATPLQALLQVTLPSIRFGLFGAAIFSFLASWDEVVLAIFMSSPRLQTFPVMIWTIVRQDLTPVIAAASTVIVLLTAFVLLIGALGARTLRS